MRGIAMHAKSLISLGLLAAVLCSGCATTTGGSDQVANTVIANHRILKNMDMNLAGSIEQLNETAADLGERVNQGGTSARQMQSIAEENQRKLDNLQARLDQLTIKVYELMGATPPTDLAPAPYRPSVQVGTPQISPPATAPAASGEAAEDVAPLEPLSTTTVPAAPTAPPANPVLDYQRAQQNYRGEQYQQALQQFTVFLEQYADNEYTDNAMFWKARCLYKLDKYQDAIASYNQLRAKFPNGEWAPRAMHDQASAHLKLGQQARALELLKQLVEEYPMSPAAQQAQATLKENQIN
jgi:tol-pal system protein YbgF